MSETAHDVLWRRLKYLLSPQWDLYVSLRERLAGFRVLEIGFGTGAGVAQYAPLAQMVDAIDSDPGAVHFAQSTFPFPNVRWIHGDVTAWYTPNRYDYAIAIETLEHVADWHAALRNIQDFLIPGGYLIMSARNANADLRRWKDLHERELSARELVSTLKVFFPQVYLFDYALAEEQTDQTRLTPLVAIARKAIE